MNLKGDLHKEMEQLSEDLTKRYDELGMRASGNWAKSKEVKTEVKDLRIISTLYGPQYTGALEFGRGPTKKSSSGGGKTLQERIEEWINVKGISSDIPVRSLAFLIARRIHQEGTRYYRQGGTDLISSVVTEDRIADMIERIGILGTNVVVSGILDKYKQMVTA